MPDIEHDDALEPDTRWPIEQEGSSLPDSGRSSVKRRRPVPREWRENNHALRIVTRAWGRGFRRVSRAKGYCSCGARWPSSPNMNNLTPVAVRDAYNDHVERAYYGEANAS